MNMLELSKDAIRELCKNENTYLFGEKLVQRKAVLSLKHDETSGYVVARVKDSWLYKTSFSVDAQAQLAGFYCTCDENRKQAIICRHLTATLLSFYDMKKADIEAQQANQQALTYLLENMHTANTHSQIAKEVLTVTPKLSISGTAGNPSVYMQISVGNKNAYVVKNMMQFIRSWSSQKPFEFGKKLTGDPNQHRLDPRGEQIIKILDNLFEVEQYWRQYSNNMPNYFYNVKQVYLTDKTLYFLLHLFCGETILAEVFDGPVQEIPIIEELPPLQFKLTEVGESLCLEMSKTDPPVMLSKNNPIYLYGNKIFLTPRKKGKLVDVVINAFQRLQGDKLIIPPGEKARFVDEIIPSMNQVAGIQVSRSLKEKIIQTDPDISVYLDLYRQGILASIRFQYGEVVYDGLAGEIQENQGGFYVVRQRSTEEKAIQSFIKLGFEKQMNGLVLEDEEAVFNFIYKNLPVLQEKIDVFFSEDFKKLKIKRQFKVSGRITIEEDMLSLSLETSDIDKKELQSILETLQKKKKYFRLKTGEFLPMEEFKELEAIARFAGEMDIKPEELTQKAIHLPKYRALYLDALLKEAPNRHIQRTDLFQQFIDKFSYADTSENTLPRQLNDIMRDYQKTGYFWLKNISAYGMGGILADDMGLGKTLQMLAVIYSEHGNNHIPSLVVTPTTLVYNWQQEAEKFIPELKVLVISGHKDERNQLFQEAANYDLVVTSYPLIRRDIDSYRNMQFQYLILDEAQHVKNHLSQTAKAVRLIPSKHRFVMTGTPMENSLDELWSIFDFVMPGYLFNHAKFEKRYINTISGGKDETAAQDLSCHIKPFILRRMKKDVLNELPEKIETLLPCEMTESQKKVYLALLMQVKDEMARDIEASGFENVQLKILAAMMRLRQVCCHPATFLRNYEGGSGKLNMLVEILQESVSGGHRILLFSQFTSMLDIIGNELKKLNITYFYLSGSTPSKERRDMVKQFNEGQRTVFLLSLKAGGTGLNLTSADTVIHYDPWWNPAVEDQATDRAYRIGQKNVVQVMKLVTRNSIEEKILKLQERKKELIDRIIQPGENPLHKMSREELEDLFKD